MVEQKIKNINYRMFLDKGFIKILSESDINTALDNIKGRHRTEARALVITLYLTGARPVEVLQLKAKDFKRDKSYLVVQMPAAKHGLARPIYLRYKLPMVKELYKYTVGLFSEMFVFYHFKANYVREYQTKSGIKQTVDYSNNLRYYFKKWFKDIDITPYYLRHNRFSSLAAKGANEEQLRQIKGAKTLASVTVYSHLSAKSAKDIAKKID